MRRLINDIAAQAAPVIVTVIDRLVLTALLVRTLGVADFEYWTLCLALVAILAVVDSGCLMNFSNAIVKAEVAGNRKLAIKVFRQSNLIFVGLGAIVLGLSLIVAVNPALQTNLGLRPTDPAGSEPLVLMFLGVAVAVRLALSNTMSVYRATLEFGRGTFLGALADGARLLAVAVAVLGGDGLIGAATAYMVTSVATAVALFLFDIGRRHPDYAFAIAWPKQDAMQGSLRNIAAFGLPYVTLVAMTQGPVMLLGGLQAAGAGIVAQFVLLRTLGNLCRLLISRVTNIVGMELARHHFAARHDYVRQTFAAIEPVFAVSLGLTAGLIFANGDVLMTLWVGDVIAYDPLVLVLLTLPIFLMPTYLIHSATIQYGNAPMIWTIGSIAQLPCALAIYALVPDLPPLLRVALAISLSEIICLTAPISLHSLYGVSRGSVINRLAGLAIASAIAAGSYGAKLVIENSLALDSVRTLLVHIVVTAAIAALLVGLWWRSLSSLFKGLAQ